MALKSTPFFCLNHSTLKEQCLGIGIFVSAIPGWIALLLGCFGNAQEISSILGTTSRVLVLDSMKAPVSGAIVSVTESRSQKIWFTADDGVCEINDPSGLASFIEVFHPTKPESRFFMFYEKAEWLDQDRITLTLEHDYCGRFFLVEDSGESLSNFLVTTKLDASQKNLGFGFTSTKDVLVSDKSGVLDIRGLCARSKYVVEIGRQDVKINVTDWLDAKEGQDHFVPDEYISENRSVFESSQMKSMDELEVRHCRSPVMG